jgi:hypothetical protein
LKPQINPFLILPHSLADDLLRSHRLPRDASLFRFSLRPRQPHPRHWYLSLSIFSACMLLISWFGFSYEFSRIKFNCFGLSLLRINFWVLLWLFWD